MARLSVSIFAIAALLALFGTFCNAQDDGDMEGMPMHDGDGDDDGDDGYGDGDGMDGDGDDGDGDGGGRQAEEVKELKTISDFDEFLDNADASIVGAFTAEKLADPKATRPHDWDEEEDGEWEAPTVDHPGLVSLREISSSIYSARFAYTTAPEVLEKLKFKVGGFLSGLYLYRSPWYTSKDKEHDRARERFPSDTFSKEGVSHWIDTKAQPLVGEFNQNTQARYSTPVLVIFMDLDRTNVKSVNYVLKRARKVAASLVGKLAFAVGSVTDMSYELEDYGLPSTTKSSEIRMGIREGSDDSDSQKKYAAPADKTFSGDSLAAFAKAYLAGELQPHKKPESQDADEADDKGDADAEPKKIEL